MSKQIPNLDTETPLWKQGLTVVGLDEVGRGAWAGPMVVGAVVLTAFSKPPAGVKDSKLLSAIKRESLVIEIEKVALSYALGSATALEIDELGLIPALGLAATRALAGLSCNVDVALLDGPLDFLVRSPEVHNISKVIPLVKGDLHCTTIACASILAKVYRDALMVDLASSNFLEYGWQTNKGYMTIAHRRAVETYGMTSQHRRRWTVPVLKK